MRVGSVSTSLGYDQAAGSSNTKAKLVSFEAFYRDNYRQVLGVALALTRSLTEAEDLAQEAFMAAHRSWDRISQYDVPGAWVRRVMVNKATSLRRRLGAQTRAFSRVQPLASQPPDLSPETDEIWRHVRRLPRRQQQAIALHYVAQLSIDEVADVMACSTGAVKSHLHRARESLRRPLEDWRTT